MDAEVQVDEAALRRMVAELLSQGTIAKSRLAGVAELRCKCGALLERIVWGPAVSVGSVTDEVVCRTVVGDAPISAAQFLFRGARPWHARRRFGTGWRWTCSVCAISYEADDIELDEVLHRQRGRLTMGTDVGRVRSSLRRAPARPASR
jgi:hypothetical protein